MTNWLINTFLNNKKRYVFGYFAGIVGIITNVILVILKLFIGYMSGSIAIIADGYNNLSDSISSFVTILGFKLSAKTADKEHPFGHGRFEYIAGLIVSFIIFIVGIELIKTSVDKIISPIHIDYQLITIIILIVTIFIKLWLKQFYLKISKKINSSSVKAASIDSRNDVLCTLAVLFSTIIAKYFKINIDGYVGVLLSMFIIYSGIKLINEMLNPLLGEAPDPKLVNKIKKIVNSYDGILGNHDLIIHEYGPSNQFASIHVEMSSELNNVKAHEIIDKIEQRLLEEENIHMIIHLDPVNQKK